MRGSARLRLHLRIASLFARIARLTSLSHLTALRSLFFRGRLLDVVSVLPRPFFSILHLPGSNLRGSCRCEKHRSFGHFLAERMEPKKRWSRIEPYFLPRHCERAARRYKKQIEPTKHSTKSLLGDLAVQDHQTKTSEVPVMARARLARVRRLIRFSNFIMHVNKKRTLAVTPWL